MIQILKKSNCCGCNACSQICPKQCISMREDNEGFLYPQINKTLCIDCHLCEKVCPILNQFPIRKPKRIYAAKSHNIQIKNESSSGGIFTLLANRVIEERGVVFGACFNSKWEVIHDFTESKQGIAKFRGSKYVQSNIGNNFQIAKDFLKQGRKVLFSGTPCQIAGLKRFLQKDYNNLITIDFICHGVPSPKIWKIYLKETVFKLLEKSLKTSDFPVHTHKEYYNIISSINFRDKSFGWKKYSFSLKLNHPKLEGGNTVFCDPMDKNIYLQGFIRNIFLRPSCYKCPMKNFKSQSDYTLADYWGVEKFHPSFYDPHGVSLLFIHNDKCNISELKIELQESTLSNALDQNPAISESAKYRKNRALFFSNLEQNSISISMSIKRYSQWNFEEKTRLIIIKILMKLHLLSFIKQLLKR